MGELGSAEEMVGMGMMRFIVEETCTLESTAL